MKKLMAELLARLDEEHAKWGVPPDPLNDLAENWERAIFAKRISEHGIIGFIDDYALIYIPHDEIGKASRNAYRILSERLKKSGHTLHMVHPMNLRSVKLTRRIGAKPMGRDDNGFIHYLLRSEDFPHHSEDKTHGEEISSS